MSGAQADYIGCEVDLPLTKDSVIPLEVHTRHPSGPTKMQASAAILSDHVCRERFALSGPAPTLDHRLSVLANYVNVSPII